MAKRVPKVTHVGPVNYFAIRAAEVTRAERVFLQQSATRIAARFPSPVFVNIGVLHGCSMWCLRGGAEEAELYGVDIDYGPHIAGKERLKATFIEGDSGIVHCDFHRPIHLLFIDGAHRYEYVKADIVGWVPKIVPNGMVIFHDYSPTERNLRFVPSVSGVREAVDEWTSTWSDDDPWRAVPHPPNSLFAAYRGKEEP